MMSHVTVAVTVWESRVAIGAGIAMAAIIGRGPLKMGAGPPERSTVS